MTWRGRQHVQWLFFVSLFCLIVATVVVFLLLLPSDFDPGHVPYPVSPTIPPTKTVNSEEESSLVPEIVPNELSEIPSYIFNMDLADEIKKLYLAKMKSITQCQIQNKCPKRVLAFTGCLQEPCDGVANQLVGLASAFYLAYATDRIFYVNWSYPYDLSTLYDWKHLYTDIVSPDEYTKLTANLTNVVHFQKNLPTYGDWINTETIGLSLAHYDMSLIRLLKTDVYFRPVLESLFGNTATFKRRNYKVELKEDIMVAVALRSILSTPSPNFTNLVVDFWKKMYASVDPPPGRKLLPGGRLIGNLGITIFGVYAPFGDTVLDERQHLEASCLADGIVDAIVYHGLFTGIAGVFVGSDSEEARKVIVDSVRRRGVAALSLDNDKIIRQLDIATTDWASINHLRSLVEWAIFSRAEVQFYTYRQPLFGDVALMVADRLSAENGEMAAYYLPNPQLPSPGSDFCQLNSI